MSALELRGSAVAERRVEPLRVVEDLDVVVYQNLAQANEVQIP